MSAGALRLYAFCLTGAPFFICLQGGLLFLGQLFLAFGEIATLPTKWEARAVFGKQSTGAGFYNVLPFILSAYLVDALTVLLKSVTYACAIFFLAGLNPGNFGERFAYFILVLFSLSLFVSTYARLLSTFSNKDIANAIAGVGLIVMVIFSGFLGKFRRPDGCLFPASGLSVVFWVFFLGARLVCPFPIPAPSHAPTHSRTHSLSTSHSFRSLCHSLWLLLPHSLTPDSGQGQHSQLPHLAVLDQSRAVRLLCTPHQ